MNNQSAHGAPAMSLKKPRSGPLDTPVRNPFVGDPPLSQARALGVEYPRPNSLSKNAQRNSTPNASRNKIKASVPRR